MVATEKGEARLGDDRAEISGDGVALIEKGEPPKGGTTDGGEIEKPALEVIKRAEAILNQGGDPGERILEARGLLAEEIRRWRTDC